MKNSKLVAIRIVITIIIIAGLIFGGRKLIMKKKQKMAKVPKLKLKGKLVKTQKAIRGNLELEYHYIATVEPIQTAKIAARVTANINQVLAKEGDLVKKGDVIAILDNRDIKNAMQILLAQIKQAEVEAEANQATVQALQSTAKYWLNEKNRDAKLVKKGVIPSSQAQASNEKYNTARGKKITAEKKLLVVKQQIAMLKCKVDDLNTKLTYYNITAPFTGVISAKLADSGNLATPSKPIFILEQTDQIKILFSIPQCDLPFIKKETVLEFKYLNKTYKSKITRIYPKLNQARMVTAETILNRKQTQKLPLGAYLNLKVKFAQYKNVILVPNNALFKHNEKWQLYIVKKGILHRQTIKLLGNGNKLSAVSGIQVDDKIVINSFLGWAGLVDGMKIGGK